MNGIESFVNNASNFLANPGVWIVVLVVGVFIWLLTSRNMSVLGGLIVIFVIMILMRWVAPMAVRAFNGGVADANSEWQRTCIEAGTCVSGTKYGSGVPQNQQADQGGGGRYQGNSEGGGTTYYAPDPELSGGGNTNPQALTAPDPQPQVIRRLKANALEIWFSTLPLQPSDWLPGASPSMIPEGAIATTSCVSSCDIFAGKTGESWEIIVKLPKVPGVKPIKLTANAFVAADKRSFQGAWGKTIQVAGTGLWEDCPECWDEIVLTPEPTQPPAAPAITPTPPPPAAANPPASAPAGDVTFAPNQGFCGWFWAADQQVWKLWSCTGGVADSRRVGYTAEEAQSHGVDLSKYPAHP